MDVVPSPKFHDHVVGFPVLSFIKVTRTGSGVSGIIARKFAIGPTPGTGGSGMGGSGSGVGSGGIIGSGGSGVGAGGSGVGLPGTHVTLHMAQPLHPPCEDTGAGSHDSIRYPGGGT